MRIVQLLPAFHYGDAIGNDARVLAHLFAEAGYPSDIVALESDPETAGLCLPPERFRALDGPETVVILHFALPSPLDTLYRKAKGRRILVYHNITPPGFLRGYPHLQRIAVAGRNALAALADVTDRALGDSAFNRQELEETGFRNTAEMPVFIDFETLRSRPSPVLLKMFHDDFVNILFVGRLTPNKCQHDLIRWYGCYKRFVRERSRLFLVGKWDGFESYGYGLMKMAAALKLGDVYFTGRVTPEDLVSYYRLADVFVSMSEHEGFGVPYVESMFFDIPVVAYRAGATPWTLGRSGVLFDDKERFRELAELVDMLAVDGELRRAVLARQRERLSYFDTKRLSERWIQEVRSLAAAKSDGVEHG